MAETDMYSKQMSLFDEGGMADDGMDVDPVSGNEVPPGSMAEEVRDDVDAKLSSGEYVVPADVVQYFGLKFFEGLRSKAKGALEDMDKDGRIGGAPSEEASMGGEEELSPEEMAMLEEIMAGGGQEAPVQMAEGGLTPGYTPSPSTFNPKDWSTVGSSYQSKSSTSTDNTVYKSYTGPSGETRLIAFVDGKPTTPIPKGFVPKGTPAETLERTPEEIEAEELQAMELANRGPSEEGNDEPSQSWGESNAEALGKDPNAVGMASLGKETIGDGIMGMAPGIMGGLVGLGDAGQNVAAVAAANAASRIGKDQGKDMSDLDNAISEAKSGWGNAENAINGLFGSDGDRAYNSYQEAQEAKAQAKEVAKEVSKTTSTTTKSDPTPTTTPSVMPSTESNDDDNESTGSTGGSRSGGLGGGEMNKGGLVKKRTTKKTTKKTQPKKKGLASK